MTLLDKERQKLIIEAVDRAEGAFQTIRSLLESMPKTQSLIEHEAAVRGLGDPPSPKVTVPSGKVRSQKYAMAQNLPAASLGNTPNYQDEDWPETIEPRLIVASDADDAEKQFRALQIVGVPGPDFFKDSTTILDYGCGEGHLATELVSLAKRVVGYDIKENSKWASNDNLILTSDQLTVVNNAPYDRIVLYDVLDHLENIGPLDLFNYLTPLMTPDAKIFCRCHPWTARHGSHLYEKINKAFIHLALTPEELMQDGYELDYNLKIVKPMAAYDNWFNQAGLTIESKKVTKDHVEDYFQGDLLDRIIKVTWGGKMDREHALKIMSNCQIDYILGKKH